MERALKLIIGQEHRDLPVEINVSSEVYAVTFSANGEHLLSGDDQGVRVWRVEDGKQAARMEAKDVRCLTVSKDGRWIAAGTTSGDVVVWDTKTYEQVFKHWGDGQNIKGVDFSPDSSRLVSASNNYTASIWDVTTRKRIQALDHKSLVRVAKFSPQGDRIATATPDSIRVWDSKDGCLLVDIKVPVTPWYNTGLLWSNNHLFAISNGKIKQIDSSTGSAVSEWSVPESDGYSCIALLKKGKFISHSAKRTVAFWDTSSHAKLGYIQHLQDIRSIALSPDDDFIAITGQHGNIIVRRLSRIIVSVLSFWIMVYISNFLVPIIQSIYLVYTPGTRYSDKRRCAPCLEAQSTRKRRSIVG